MWIKALRIKDFGALGTGEFSFSRGLNVVYGPNEAGKTTLFEAVERALLEGVRLPRQYRGEAEVLLVTGQGEVWVGPRRRTRPQVLKEMRQRVFESLYFVRTGELAFRDQQELLRDLKGRLLDTGRLYRAMDHIREKLGRDLNPLGERGRKDGELTQELRDLREELRALEERVRLLEESRADLARLQSLKVSHREAAEQWEGLKGRARLLRMVYEKRGLRGAYRDLQREMGEARKREGLKRRLKDLEDFTPERLKALREREEDGRRARETVPHLSKDLRDREGELRDKEQALEEVRRELEKLGVEEERLAVRAEGLRGVDEEGLHRLTELEARERALKEGLRGLEDSLAPLQGEIQGLQQRREALQRRLSSRRWLQGAAWAVTALGLLLLAAGLMTSKGLLIPGGVLAAAGLLGGIWLRAGGTARTERALGEELASLRGKVEGLQGERRTKEAELEEVQGEMGEILRRAGVEGPEGYRRKVEDLRRLEEEMRHLKTRKEALGRRAKELQEEVSGLKGKLEEARRALEEAQGEGERAEAEVLEALRELGLRSLRELEERVREREEVERGLRELEAKPPRPVAELQRELERVEVRLKELADVPDRLPEEEALELRLRAAEERVRELEREIHLLEGRIRERERAIGYGEEELFGRLEALRREIREKQEEWEDLFEIFRVLKDLEGDLEGELRERLEGRASEWFRFVLGRDAPLSIRLEGTDIKVSDGRLTRGVKELSSGTRDPLYFAARVAIAERVEGLRVLLLDDPFLTCDPDRTERLVELLRRLSERFQIILATKDPGLRDLMLRAGAHGLELPTKEAS